VSDAARVCPHCGSPFPAWNQPQRTPAGEAVRWVARAIFFPAALLFWGAFFTHLDPLEWEWAVGAIVATVFSAMTFARKWPPF
jgi:hypothetical protein